MNVTEPAHYALFHCLAGACPDTCCVGWEVVVDEKSARRYRGVGGALGDRLRAALETTDGEYSFHLNDGRCPFLNGENLCDIHAALGGGALCRTCRLFPRFYHDYGAVREVGLSLSCPEAARLIMDAARMTFETREDASLEVEPNDIDAALYLKLRALRHELIALAQNRAYSISERMALCLQVAAEAQKRLNAGAETQSLCAACRDAGFCREKLEEARRITAGGRSAGLIWRDWLNDLSALERLTDRWGGVLAGAYAASGAAGPDGEYENLLVYYLYRYFLESVFDGAAYRSVKLAVLSVALIRRLHCAEKGADKARRIELARLYSREIEHSQDNLDAVWALLGDVNRGGKRWLLKMCIEAGA